MSGQRQVSRSETSKGRQLLPAATAAVIALLLVGALIAGTGHQTQHISLNSGSVWVASPEHGYVTLIDGPSEEVVATTLTPWAGPTLRVTQFGMSALASNSATGEVAVIDGATYETTKMASFARPGSELSVMAAGGSAFVIDATSRVATVADPTDLRVVRALALAASPGSQQSLVDDTGRLWTVDSQGGGITWVDGDGTEGHASAGRSARLVQALDRPVLVDFGEGEPQISWLDRDGGVEPWPCDLVTRPSDDLQVLGSADSRQVFVAISQTGTLLVANSEGTDCGSVIQFDDPQSEFGPPAQSGQFVFVPNHTTGRTAVLDISSLQKVADIPLTDPGNNLELLAKDGLVFYNDLDSEKAGVLRLGDDGVWVAGRSLHKFNPATGEPEHAVLPSDFAVTAGETFDAAATADTAVSASNPTRSSVPATSSVATPPVSQPSSTFLPGPTVLGSVPGQGGSSRPPDTPSQETPSQPPTPQIVDIAVSPASLTTGANATFTATVTNPSGQWTWAATSNSGVSLGESNSEGAFVIPLPDSGIASVTVTLTVGTSPVFSRGFGVQQVIADTTTELDVSRQPEGTGYWTIDPLSVTVNVASDSGGSVPTGDVTLTLISSSGVPVARSGESATLVDGQATFSGLSAPAGELTFAATYSGDAAHNPSTNGTFIQVFVKPQFLRWSICNGFTVELVTETGPDTVAVSMEWYDGPGGPVIGSGPFSYLGPLGPHQWEFTYQGSRPETLAPWAFTITLLDTNTNRSQAFVFDNAGLGGCIG